MSWLLVSNSPPDGKFLITVGGDGCILQWRLGGLLRSAMKERMLELYAVAKRKQEGANDAVGTATSTSFYKCSIV